MGHCTCEKEEHGYYRLTCCRGSCPEQDKMAKMQLEDGDKVVSYYQYQTVKQDYVEDGDKVVSYYQYQTVKQDYVVKRGPDRGKTK